MGVGDIIGLGLCWLLVAAVLVWGVLGGRWRARGRVVDVPAAPGRAWDWVVVESLPGSGPDVRRQGELLVAAALAARGVDPGSLRRGDRRVEVTPGGSQTRFLLRRDVLAGAEPG